MIDRTFDIAGLLTTMDPYLKDLHGFHGPEWLGNQDNVALTDGEGSFSLFERESGGVVSGHYFLIKRGREALNLCSEMLKEIFTGPYNVKVIRGITPLENLGARWMSRQLGFKSYGSVQTLVGPCEIVILTKPEWEKRTSTDE